MLFVENIATYSPLVIEDNFKLERFCTNSLGQSIEICNTLANGSLVDIQVKTQRMTNLYNMFEDMIGSFIPIIILLFIVSWSDHFGRRFLIMMSLVGKILDMIVYVITTLVPSCPAPVLIVGQLLRSLGGDNIIFSNAVYSFIADRTNG